MSERHLRLIEGGKSEYEPATQINDYLYHNFFKPSGEMSDLISSIPNGHAGIEELILSLDLMDAVNKSVTGKLFSAKYKRVEGESTSTDFEFTTSNFRTEEYFQNHPDNFKIHNNLKTYINKAMPTRTALERFNALNVFEVGRYLGRLVHEEFDETTKEVFQIEPIGAENFYSLLFRDRVDTQQLNLEARIIYYQKSQPERFATKMGNNFLAESGYDDSEIDMLNHLMKNSAMAAAKTGVGEGTWSELGAAHPMNDHEFSLILQQLSYYPESDDDEGFVKDLF